MLSVFEKRRLRLVLSAVRPVSRGIRLGYLSMQFPDRPDGRDASLRGGAVKLRHLDREFPHSIGEMNCLYAVSSIGHPYSGLVFREAKRRGVKVVWNQNGVYYGAWCGQGWQKLNRHMAFLRGESAYVVYQSDFCRMSADKFLGRFDGPSSVLHNPVDLDEFSPPPWRDASELILLTLDTPFWLYRLECAIAALASVTRAGMMARLLVPGGNTIANRSQAKELSLLARTLGVEDRVTFLPGFTPRQAPAVLRQAHVLVHPQYNDACPNFVVEAMACGLPAVYSATGGVPELVGSDAGIGIPGPMDWDRVHPPSAEALAEAILRIAGKRREFSEAARARAEAKFSVSHWTSAHRVIFESVLDGDPPVRAAASARRGVA